MFDDAEDRHLHPLFHGRAMYLLTKPSDGCRGSASGFGVSLRRSEPIVGSFAHVACFTHHAPHPAMQADSIHQRYAGT